MNSRIFTSLLLSTLLFGCASSPDARIQAHQAAYDRLSPEDQGKVRGGHVDVGFTPEMVLMALGEPDRRYTRTTADGTDEVWAYADRGGHFSIGIGIAGGGGSGGAAAGVAVGNGDRRDDKVRIVFHNEHVIAIEKTNR